MARERYLAEHPLCVYCMGMGKVTPATVVDHIIPHRGDMDLFWDEGNWQALCSPHHDSTKKREEHKGSSIGCDEHGNPLGGWQA
jgi:5-methylcytosine-specific restriction protein A